MFPAFRSFLLTGLLLVPVFGYLNAGEPSGRYALVLDPASIRIIGGPKSLVVTAMEGGGIRITYDNSDFASKGEFIIQKIIDPPATLSRVGFEMKMAASERPTATCSFVGGKGMECRLEGQGTMLAEYLADFAEIATAKEIEMKPVGALNIRVGISQESGEQTVELKKWWYE